MATISSFSLAGGMNARGSSLLLKDNEAELIKNFHLDRVGALTKRNGFRFFGDDFMGTTSNPSGGIVNVFQHIGSTATNNTFLMSYGAVVRQMRTTTLNGGIAASATTIVLTDATNFDDPAGASNGRIEIDGDVINYTDKNGNNLTGCTGVENAHSDGATVHQWDAESTLTNATGRVRFVTFLDNTMYMGTGASDTVAKPFGASVTLNTIGLGVALGDVFQDRLYHSGLSTAKSRLYFSSLPSSGQITWDTTNDWVDINPDDGDEITALKTAGTRLLVFKKNAVYTWKFGLTQADKIFDVGTPSQETVQSIHGITFFANRFGVYAWNFGSDAQPRLISRKIQRWIDAIDSTNLTSQTAGMTSGIDNDHYYLSIGNVTVDGRSYTDVILVYHISLDAWTIYTGIPARAWTSYLESNTSFVVFARGNGAVATNVGVFRFNIGNADAGSTVASDITGNAIEAEFIGKEHVLSMTNESELKTIHTASNQAVATNLYVSRDGGKFEPKENLVERFSHTSLNGKAHSVRVKLGDNSKNTPIFEGYLIEHEIRKPIKK